MPDMAHLDRQAERGYWLPVDAEEDDNTNWISNAHISDTLKAMAAHRVLIIADSCFSGSLTRGAELGVREPRNADWLARIAAKRSRTVLASGGLEPVVDGGRNGHSVFASALLEVLRENDSIMDGQTLFDRLKGRVVVNAEQTPSYGDIRLAYHEGGDFILLPAGSQAPSPRLTTAAVGRTTTETRNVGQAAVGTAFRDCEDCPELVVLPAGAFMMGSSRRERDWAMRQGAPMAWIQTEAPRHRVRMSRAIAIGRYEVTVAEFARFASDTGHDGDGGCRIRGNGQWRNSIEASWRRPGFSQGDSEPVVCVSWHDAKAYAAWLSARTGHSYRLPSEAEWEYAARGGSLRYRYWGDDEDGREACRFANLADQGLQRILPASCQDGFATTAPVGRFSPNPFGLHDMLGNVWEWVEDCGSEDYSQATSDASPFRAEGCRTRSLRGGAWSSLSWGARSASRGPQRARATHRRRRVPHRQGS